MHCTVCGSEDVAHKFAIREFSYFFCRGCGSLFVDPALLTPEVYNLYNNQYYENNSYDPEEDKKGYPSYSDSEQTLKDSFSNKLLVVKKYSRCGALLDAGAAYGYFLSLAKADFQCTGLEVSEYASKVASETHGLNVVTGSLEKTEFADSQFDAVTMWDIIEHIIDPVQALKEVSRILKPAGYLFVSTDDASHWLPRFLSRKWWALGAPYHVFHFSKKALDHAAAVAGFEKPIYLKDPRKYTVSEIVTHFGVSYGSTFLKGLARILEKMLIGKISINIARPEQFIAVMKKAV